MPGSIQRQKTFLLYLGLLITHREFVTRDFLKLKFLNSPLKQSDSYKRLGIFEVGSLEVLTMPSEDYNLGVPFH